MVIHTETCRNLSEHKYPPEHYLDVQWEPGVDEEFPVEISVEVANRRGVLASVAAAIGECESNIENVAIEERDGLTNTLQFTLSVHNRKHLAEVMRRVRGINSVMRITRLRN
jgi:(p)ppGpp synthase/HD superfamily hydrolase